MKFFFIPAACLVVLFSSCKKQGNGPTNSTNTTNNTITATVDGVNVNFSTNAFAYISSTEPGAYPNALVINGATDTTSSKTLITFSVFSENLITSGTFPYSDTNPEPVTFSQIIYEQTATGSQLTQDYITNGLVPGSTSITISSISDTNVQGTFTGTVVYSISGTAMPAKTITNGKFNLTIK